MIHSSSDEPAGTAGDDNEKSQVHVVGVQLRLTNLTEMELIDEKFDDLMESADSPAKKPEEEENKERGGESVMKWIENVGDSLVGEANPTEQVLLTRYSNVTLNTSLAPNPAPYDATTPKVSILQTVGHIESLTKKKQLAQSPLTRLSVTIDNSEVLENYQLKDVTKSLRSTRKPIGIAMTSLHDRSSIADTTIDVNETIGSIAEDANQSTAEAPAFLSLNGLAANNYIQLASEDRIRD